MLFNSRLYIRDCDLWPGRRYCTTTRVAVDCGGLWKCLRTCSSRSSSSTRWTTPSSASSSRRKASSSSGGGCRPVTGSASSGCCVKNQRARGLRAHSPPYPSHPLLCRSSTSALRRSQCSLTGQSVSTSLKPTVSFDRSRSPVYSSTTPLSFTLLLYGASFNTLNVSRRITSNLKYWQNGFFLYSIGIAVILIDLCKSCGHRLVAACDLIMYWVEESNGTNLPRLWELRRFLSRAWMLGAQMRLGVAYCVTFR